MIDNIKDIIFAKIFSTAGILMCFITLITNNLAIIIGISFLIFVDTLLGIIIAIKSKTFCYKKLFKISLKLLFYSTLMCAGIAINKVIPEWNLMTEKIFAAFIIGRELMSIIAKFSNLGIKMNLGKVINFYRTIKGISAGETIDESSNKNNIENQELTNDIKTIKKFKKYDKLSNIEKT
jgi:phage-related holin